MRATLDTIDRWLITLVTGMPARLRWLMEVASLIGQPVCMMGLAAVAVGLKPVWLPYGLGIGGVIVASSALKLMLRRTRPDTYIHKLYRTYSFPSGHAVGTSITLGLGIALAPHMLNQPALWLWNLTSICLVGLIGVSRVYLGAHYPSDVLGGWLIGLVSVGIILATVPTI